jgi:hypothetical protein
VGFTHETPPADASPHFWPEEFASLLARWLEEDRTDEGDAEFLRRWRALYERAILEWNVWTRQINIVLKRIPATLSEVAFANVAKCRIQGVGRPSAAARACWQAGDGYCDGQMASLVGILRPRWVLAPIDDLPRRMFPGIGVKTWVYGPKPAGWADQIASQIRSGSP